MRLKSCLLRALLHSPRTRIVKVKVEVPCPLGLVRRTLARNRAAEMAVKRWKMRRNVWVHRDSERPAKNWRHLMMLERVAHAEVSTIRMVLTRRGVIDLTIEGQPQYV